MGQCDLSAGDSIFECWFGWPKTIPNDRDDEQGHGMNFFALHWRFVSQFTLGLNRNRYLNRSSQTTTDIDLKPPRQKVHLYLIVVLPRHHAQSSNKRRLSPICIWPHDTTVWEMLFHAVVATSAKKAGCLGETFWGKNLFGGFPKTAGKSQQIWLFWLHIQFRTAVTWQHPTPWLALTAEMI